MNRNIRRKIPKKFLLVFLEPPKDFSVIFDYFLIQVLKCSLNVYLLSYFTYFLTLLTFLLNLLSYFTYFLTLLTFLLSTQGDILEGFIFAIWLYVLKNYPPKGESGESDPPPFQWTEVNWGNETNLTLTGKISPPWRYFLLKKSFIISNLDVFF